MGTAGEMSIRLSAGLKGTLFEAEGGAANKSRVVRVGLLGAELIDMVDAKEMSMSTSMSRSDER